MSDRTPMEAGLDQLERLERKLDRLCYEIAAQRIPAELASFRFDGKAGVTEVVDDVGAPVVSYGIYNPNEFAVFVAMQGGPARPNAGCLEVPKQKLAVFPFAVSGHVALGVDPEAIGEENGLIFRARFHTVQPFFVGALA